MSPKGKSTETDSSASRFGVESVLKEYAPIGKYRIRLIQGKKKDAPKTLDIREYVAAEAFEGFTRRGIRISDRVHLDLLRDVIKEVLDQGLI